MYRPRKRKPKTKFFVILALSALFVTGIVLLLVFGLSKTHIADQGSLTYSGDFSGIIIRNEKVYEADEYARAVFVATEGEHVEEGTMIAEVYKLGYSEYTLKELTDKQKTIKEYQVNLLGDVINAGLIEFNEKIELKSDEICAVISGEKDGDLITLEREMDELLDGRIEYLKSVVNPDDILKGYYEDEEVLEEKIANWRINVSASEAGTVSFYFDGLEAVMVPENIENLTISTINDLLNGVSGTGVVSSASSPLYRIVDADSWHVLLLASSQVREFIDGLEVSLVFDDVADAQYTGTIVGGRSDSRGYIYTVQVDGNIGDLLSSRKVKVAVTKKYDGIIIPADAVKEKDGLYTVTVETGSGNQSVAVEVLEVQGETAVVKPVTDDGVLRSGSQVVY